MNLLIPSLALALVAIFLLIAIGKILGGHSAKSGQDSPPPERAQDLIRPPASGAPLAPPAPSPPARLEAAPAGGDPAQDPEVLEALASGKKILAIKRYRELTGLGLKESKEAVERLQARGPRSPEPKRAATGGDPSQDPQVLEALASGKKILAIKRYRELTGLGLKESKDAVDRM